MNRLTDVAMAIAFALATGNAHAADVSAFKGQCAQDSGLKSTVTRNNIKTTTEKPLACDGIMLIERDDGRKIFNFLRGGDDSAEIYGFIGERYMPGNPTTARVLPIFGLYFSTNGLKETPQFVSAKGRCSFSHFEVSKSRQITCTAQQSNADGMTEYTFNFLAVSFSSGGKEIAVDQKQDRSFLLHNGSEIIATSEHGQFSMYYARPKPSLADVGVESGTLLFRGVSNDGNTKGTAFAFKKGCPPAPYEVEGRGRGDVAFELSGPGPQFGKGCSPGKLSWKSPHSRLMFVYDNRGDE
jgi:hypothetical protein